MFFTCASFEFKSDRVIGKTSLEQPTLIIAKKRLTGWLLENRFKNDTR